jgi:acetyl esterase/lipase
VSGQAPAPANVLDCKAGVRWLRTYADDFGMDPDRIGLWGSSAGGHLVSLLALTHDASEFETGDVSTEVQAVCDFCGPTDLTLMADAEMAAAYPRLREAVDEYLGGPVDEHLDLARRISPMSHVRADAPPMLIAHGENDPVVPPTESTRFQEALEETGAEDVTLCVVPDAGHGWDQSLTNDLVVEFFCRTLL